VQRGALCPGSIWPWNCLCKETVVTLRLAARGWRSAGERWDERTWLCTRGSAGPANASVFRCAPGASAEDAATSPSTTAERIVAISILEMRLYVITPRTGFFDLEINHYSTARLSTGLVPPQRRMIPPVESLVKYDTPVLVSSSRDKAKGKKSDAFSVDKKGKALQTADILNAILPPRCVAVKR